MIRDMCINFILNPLTKFTSCSSSSSSSSRGINFTDILPWNISLMIAKIVSINRRIITICTIKKEQPFWIRGKANKNCGKKTWSQFPNQEKAWRSKQQELSTNMRTLIDWWKINKKPNKIKPVKNINKNTHNFLRVSLTQKQVPPSHKLPHHDIAWVNRIFQVCLI